MPLLSGIVQFIYGLFFFFVGVQILAFLKELGFVQGNGFFGLLFFIAVNFLQFLLEFFCSLHALVG